MCSLFRWSLLGFFFSFAWLSLSISTLNEIYPVFVSPSVRYISSPQFFFFSPASLLFIPFQLQQNVVFMVDSGNFFLFSVAFSCACACDHQCISCIECHMTGFGQNGKTNCIASHTIFSISFHDQQLPSRILLPIFVVCRFYWSNVHIFKCLLVIEDGQFLFFIFF